MNEQRFGSGPDKTNRPWVALILYLAAGWAAAEVLLTVRERLGLPEVLDNLILGLLLAGLVAYALLVATGRLARQSPLVSVSRILAVSIVAASVTLGIAAWLGRDGQTAGIPSVAVLPCDYEGIEDHAFLGPAAAEELHAKLAKVAGLQIPAWRSVLKSVQVGEDRRQIAEILRVEHLASCEITEHDDGIELAASIIDPDTEALIWSGRKAYASTDLVHALSTISLAITEALSVRLTADESDRLTRAPTTNPEAYEHYLRARQAPGGSHWVIPNLMSAMAIGEEEYELAMTHYRKAVELDPTFAEAWAGMATVTRYYGSNIKQETRFGDALKDYIERAHEFASNALEHDPCNAEALLLVRRSGWIVAPEKDPPGADRVFQTDPAWGEGYERDLAELRQIIRCEPNNAKTWRTLANTYSNFAANSMRTEYPAEEMRASLMKALALDPTDCRVQEYYTSTFRTSIWAPRPEDRLTLDQTKAAIRSALLVNPECSALHQILARIAIEQGRIDEAIAWHMRRDELHPDNPVVAACQIGVLLSQLGFVEEAKGWLDRGADGGFYWCVEEDIECFQSRETYFSASCKTQRLETAQKLISSSWGTARPSILVFKYRQAMYEAESSDRPDLVRQWLDEGLEKIGADDPVAILGTNPKRLISARRQGLALVPIFRDLGLHEDAERLLELCRRDPGDPEQIFADLDDVHYVDAQHRSLAGRKAEAMELLTIAVRNHETFGGWLWPGRWELLFDRTLDPLREDPVYGPQLERLIEEQNAWLAPARERAAKALETGDWASLRTLIDEPSMTLATVSRDETDNPENSD
jgi:tetratricopeptide (TPR) repeat protein